MSSIFIESHSAIVNRKQCSDLFEQISVGNSGAIPWWMWQQPQPEAPANSMSSQASNGIKESFVNDRTGAVRSFGQEQEQEQGGMVHLLLLVLSAGDRGNIASVAFQIEIDFQPTRNL